MKYIWMRKNMQFLKYNSKYVCWKAKNTDYQYNNIVFRLILIKKILTINGMFINGEILNKKISSLY